MATIVTRETTQTDGTSPKGSPLTNAEVDTNFINLNDDKVEVSGAIIFEAKAGEALSKGDVVYVSGVSGNEPVVSKADADDASKMPAYGLAEADANLNAAVNVVTFGTLYDLDTSSFAAGDTVYVSTTAGAITTTAPTGESSLLQNIGTVIRSHASAGSIKVGGAGRTNATPNLDDGNVFIGNGSNQAVARALTGDDISGGTITSFASTGIDDNATSTAITIDSSENVGIGETSPATALHIGVGGKLRVERPDGATYSEVFMNAGASGGMEFYNNNNDGFTFSYATGDQVVIDNSGNVGIGTSSPATIFHVDKPSASCSPRFSSGTGGVFLNMRGANDTHQIQYGDGSGNPTFAFYDNTDNSTRMTIDGSGNVGIGESAPNTLLHVRGTAGNKLKLENRAVGGTNTITFTAGNNGSVDNDIEYGSLDVVSSATGGGAESGYMAFSTRNSGTTAERMRIDSSGNLLVGQSTFSTTSAGTKITSGVTNAHIFVANTEASVNKPCLYLNRQSGTGDAIHFRAANTEVGVIGVSGSDIYHGSGDTGLKYYNAGDAIHPYNPSTLANRDNAIDLGMSSIRFDDIYATNGTIQTSDINEKQDIEVLSDAEQRVAVAAKALLRKFRWKGAVEVKDNNTRSNETARIHFGIIAQDLQAAFEAEGLNASEYGMFTHSTWIDEETGEERSRMGVRYSELLAFIIAAI